MFRFGSHTCAPPDVLSTKAVVPRLWPQMQQCCPCVMTQSITLGNTQMSPAPTSAKSLSASNRRSLDTESHRTRVPPLACSSLIMAAIWRPLPTPAPSPRKKPARWPAWREQQIQCLFASFCNPDGWRIWVGVTALHCMATVMCTYQDKQQTWGYIREKGKKAMTEREHEDKHYAIWSTNTYRSVIACQSA